MPRRRRQRGSAHIVDGTVSFDGGSTFIDKTADYNVTMNNFMANGGDNYRAFKLCADPLGGEVDIDAFARYPGVHSPLVPPSLVRITRVP